MLFVPEMLNTITHRLASAIYTKQELDSEARSQNVLVIKTSFPDADDDYEMFDTYLCELLMDLEELKRQAEKSVGDVDRIDIQTRSLPDEEKRGTTFLS